MNRASKVVLAHRGDRTVITMASDIEAGPQDKVMLVLAERGRVETTNYRTVRMPTGSEVPLFVRSEFAAFYNAIFDKQVERRTGARCSSNTRGR